MAGVKNGLRKINREIVSAVIFSKDNKIFMGWIEPSRGAVYPDCWHIPGGGVQKNEDLIAALKREIIEEVGIDISKYPIKLIDNTLFGVSEKTLRQTGEKVLCHMHYNDYKIVIDDKNADEIELKMEDDEFDKVKWFDILEIPKVKLTPPSIDLFKKMGILKD